MRSAILKGPHVASVKREALIFVNRTSAPQSFASLATASNTRSVSPASTSAQSRSTDVQIRVPSQTDVVLPQALAISAYHEKTVEAFFSLYLPDYRNDVRNHMLRAHGFINVLSILYTRDEALKLAVVALGTAMLGKVLGNEEWAHQGRKLYGQALQEMRRALRSDQRAKSEALLIVPRLGAMFEIIAAIRLRKATALNKNEWKTIPWELIPKTPKDSLLDIFAGIPEILEDIDNLRLESNAPHEDALRASIITKCKILAAELTAWERIHQTNIYHPDTEKPTKIEFGDVSIAHLTLYYWTASLYIYGTLSAVSLPDAIGPYPDHIASTRETGGSSSCLSDKPRFFARRITRAVPYFFHTSCGIWGAITVAFPMGSALLCLRNDGVEGNMEYTKLVFRAWADPSLPSAIKDFLQSMRRDAAIEETHGRPKHDGEFWLY
ncbi:hypothetical protein N0V90_011844 [Kalmusia sp. IMI 367209]|nr:hypothetical protein N0V90_011844 [Kalmusia sp. IMI 367209]